MMIFTGDTKPALPCPYIICTFFLSLPKQDYETAAKIYFSQKDNALGNVGMKMIMKRHTGRRGNPYKFSTTGAVDSTPFLGC